ncbi:MAG: Sll0314/Alr1548 family TPR repeat-containing protein [Cyanobacteria bacterium P01_G01_bin.54]
MVFARHLSQQHLGQRLLSLGVATTLTTFVWGTAAWAGDPFRGNNNPSSISDQTEAAFEAMFKDGDYPQAQRIINAVQDESDPLVPALQAALAYNLDGTIQDTNNYVARTRDAAQALLDQANASSQDQIRGNLYLAAASFMEGAYAFKQNNDYVAAALQVQEIFRYLRNAEQIEQAAGSNDPELNLVKGYIELLLAVNLPLSNPDNAIANFESNAQPDYLVNRGIAIAYRDLGYKNRNEQVAQAAQYFQAASDYVERVLAVSPQNPEVQYLKAQILHEWSKLSGQENPEMLAEAIELFETVLERADQLPRDLPAQIIDHELRIAREKLAQM